MSAMWVRIWVCECNVEVERGWGGGERRVILDYLG